MSIKKRLASELAGALAEWSELQNNATAARKAPKLVRSGRAAELRNLAEEKGQEVAVLKMKLVAAVDEEVVETTTYSVEAPRIAKPWWKFW